VKPPVNQPQLVTLYPYSAMDDTQLSFNADETLILISQDFNTWWKATNASGKTGLVPVNYVKLLEDTGITPSNISSTGIQNHSKSSSFEDAGSEPGQYQPPSNQSTTPLEQYRAIYAYTATDLSQLNMAANEVFTIVKKTASGWWNAKSSSGKQGMIPSNYLQPA
jgi:hypothetical protein